MKKLSKVNINADTDVAEIAIAYLFKLKGQLKTNDDRLKICIQPVSIYITSPWLDTAGHPEISKKKSFFLHFKYKTTNFEI